MLGEPRLGESFRRPPVLTDNCPGPTRFFDQKLSDKIFIQRYAQAVAFRNGDPAIGGLDSFTSQLMPQGGIVDAVFEQERVTTRTQPVQTGRHGHRAGVTMVAQPGPDLLHALLDVVGFRESIASQINLINVESLGIDQGAP